MDRDGWDLGRVKRLAPCLSVPSSFNTTSSRDTFRFSTLALWLLLAVMPKAGATSHDEQPLQQVLKDLVPMRNSAFEWGSLW